MKPNKRQEKYAAFFQALSHRRRQMICDILLKQGPKGLTFSELQRQSGLQASTLSHHLWFMDRGGVLRRKQKGRETVLSVDFTFLRKLSSGYGERALVALSPA
ncbi:ArsR/SmtB family transcription factor [Profundibacter amoris]|uniref:ArsR family transcriptional regulator n=1 Tax=Profundibacter amoris TaxID=2171755 RepID=A0A347UF27_9RHOB|nr:winged helix-turn-helix domain-containing protein [Profundibacter amoris]AXX97455.1 ArsR family transcriptional regulator [Profundibacter amoris]